jgi:hypothetical protein
MYCVSQKTLHFRYNDQPVNAVYGKIDRSVSYLRQHSHSWFRASSGLTTIFLYLTTDLQRLTFPGVVSVGKGKR